MPSPPPDYVATVTLTDRAGRQFVVDVEVRAQYIAESLGHYARTNTGKASKACDGGVIVRFIREVE